MFDAQHRLSSTLAYVTSMANYIAFFPLYFHIPSLYIYTEYTYGVYKCYAD